MADPKDNKYIPHIHGPGCGCGLPLADDGDEEFEDEYHPA